MITITSNPKFPATRATRGSAGYDLCITKDVILTPGATVLVPTGVFVEMDPEVVGLVCSRSGLALKGIVVMNSPGIIDSDYRGEVQVMLHNFSGSLKSLDAGTRAAQLVFVNWLDSGEVVEIQREGGFGSTGE